MKANCYRNRRGEIVPIPVTVVTQAMIDRTAELAQEIVVDPTNYHYRAFDSWPLDAGVWDKKSYPIAPDGSLVGFSEESGTNAGSTDAPCERLKGF